VATSLLNRSVKTKGILSPEFIINRESCWVSCKERLVFVGCGDDREITDESSILLQHTFASRGKALSPKRAYASIFGGLAGEAKNILVVGSSIYGPRFISDVGGFDGVSKQLIINSHDIQTLHSAASNEKDERHFYMHGNDPVGCVYSSGVGITSELLVDDKNDLIRNVAKQDQRYVFGSDQNFEQLLNGHRFVLQHAINGKKASFAYSRSEYISLLNDYKNGFGIMILDWDHASAKTTGVISNFSLDQVGSSSIAHQEGLDFYRLDIAKVTKIILEAISKPLQEYGYKLPAELLMRAIQIDSTPVRAVLASEDNDSELEGVLDPRNIAIGKRGNVWDSVSRLSN
jgi:hypothetical protein